MFVELDKNTKFKIFPSFREREMVQTILSMNQSGTLFSVSKGTY